eukprot:TRINITY_DN10481_c0_g1_i1.p1 TRINITY_DN10481_c0_g1~~TRINITY_DN10481_c0_g1_i1.p1  ORF type:complete len:300 (+),score=81.33 TRINITY_DN10481_c0_g1_i1:1072-1971(+)
MPAGRQARRMRKSLGKFMCMDHFSKATLNCIAAQLDTKDIEGLSDTFRSLDTDHDGRLSLAELAAGLAELGVDPDYIGLLVDTVDMNHDGFVQYSEFVASLLHTQAKLVEDVIMHAFKVFDTNDDGRISVDELRTMLIGSGPLVAILPDGKTVQQVLEEVDTSGDGLISADEFRAYLQQDVQCPVEIGEAAQKGLAAPWTPRSDEEALEKTFVRLAVSLCRPEAELAAQAQRLKEVHWLESVGDLRELSETEWQRLELPLKLEKALRADVQGGASKRMPGPSLSPFAPPGRSKRSVTPG